MLWAIIFMIEHPEIQEKVQAEIDEQIGLDGIPCMADRNRMPYTVAAVMELQRRVNLVPINVPHKTLADTEIDGTKKFCEKESLKLNCLPRNDL